MIALGRGLGLTWQQCGELATSESNPQGIGERAVLLRVKTNGPFINRWSKFLADQLKERKVLERTIDGMSKGQLKAFIEDKLSAKAAARYEQILDSGEDKVAAAIAKDVIDRNLGKAVQPNVNVQTGSVEHVHIYQMPEQLVTEMNRMLTSGYIPPVLEGEVIAPE